MTVQQTDINKVRASVLQQLGSRVLFQLDKGRHRIEVQEGTLQNAYPGVFTIQVGEEDQEIPPQILSFSYADVLTKNIRMKLC